MKKKMFFMFLALLMIFGAGNAIAAETWHTNNQRLAYSVPNECYGGIGVDYEGATPQDSGVTPGEGFTSDPLGPNPAPYIPDCDGQIPKTNDTYLWAFTEEGDSYWFATAANVMCTTAGVFLDALTQGDSDIELGDNIPVYENHMYSENPGEPMYEHVGPDNGDPLWYEGWMPVCDGDGNDTPDLDCGPQAQEPNPDYYDCLYSVPKNIPDPDCVSGCGSDPDCISACPEIPNPNYYDELFSCPKGFPITHDIEVLSNVCEHEQSMLSRDPLDEWPDFLLGALGDWRPSKLLRLNKITGVLTNLTDQIYAAGHQEVFDDLLGIRMAGSHDGVIFFGGGNQSYSGVSLFAFREDGLYLGYTTMNEYRQIRKGRVVGDQLYIGVAATGLGGNVLKWTGTQAAPFSFQNVGNLSGSVTELSSYVDENGAQRLVVNALGIYVSPPFIAGQLRWWQVNQWTQVWSPGMYDPDFVASITYGGGALGQLGDWVYWGTMHIPFHAAYMNVVFRHGGDIENLDLTQDQQTTLFYGMNRATTIWRGRYLGSGSPEIELLYGETHLGAWQDGILPNPDYVDPVTTPEEPEFLGAYVAQPTGWTPLNMPAGFPNPLPGFLGDPALQAAWSMDSNGDPVLVGSSGFYNPATDGYPYSQPTNNYSWTVVSGNFGDGTGDHLFFGTMDQNFVSDLADYAVNDFIVPSDSNLGADLWRFSLGNHDGSDGYPSGEWGGASPTVAFPESRNGAGHIFGYGIRTLQISDDATKLLLGTAGNGNLVPQDEPPFLNGGFEFRVLTRP